MSTPPLPPLSELRALAERARDTRAAYDASVVGERGSASLYRTWMTARIALAELCPPTVLLSLLDTVERYEWDACFTADEVYDVYAVGCWDGGNVNRPKPGQESRAAAVVSRVLRARAAAPHTRGQE